MVAHAHKEPRMQRIQVWVKLCKCTVGFTW